MDLSGFRRSAGSPLGGLEHYEPAPHRKTEKGTAAVLTIGLTADAQAATGRIRYWNATDQESVITNPPDRDLSYYFGANCTNFTSNPDPGRAVAYQNPVSAKIIG